MSAEPLGGQPTDSFLQRLGARFQLQSLLGSGGQSQVYRAYDPELKRSVALKLLPAGSSDAALRRFAREGELMASLDHPGILRVFSTGAFEGRPYLACELIEGSRPLDRVLAQLSERELAQLLAEVADATGCAHAQGIVHRDLKPDNVLVDREGRARVIDFGVALALRGERLTQTGALAGTPHYMAPEQVAAHRDGVGPHSDVWALGVILYQGLTGELPFEGDTWVELAASIARAEPTAPSALGPVSPQLEAICLRALSRLPQDRFPNGAALGAVLRAYLAGEDTSSRAGALTWRRVRRSRAWLLAAPGLAIAALCAAAIGYPREPQLGRGEPPLATSPAPTPSVSPSARATPEVTPPSSDPEAPADLDPVDPTPADPAPADPDPADPDPADLKLPDLALPSLEEEPLAQTSMRTFVESAIGGDVYAMLALAACYDSGAAGLVDPERALAWYLRAAERGHGEAMLAAAKRLIGKPAGLAERTRAPAKAFELLEGALEAGVRSAARQLGQVYRYGALGRARDRERAHRLFRQRIREGDGEAAVLLAEDLAFDDPQAAREVLERGRASFPGCRFELARMAWWGEGGSRDRELALALLRELSEGSHDYYRRLARGALARQAQGRSPFRRRR